MRLNKNKLTYMFDNLMSRGTLALIGLPGSYYSRYYRCYFRGGAYNQLTSGYKFSDPDVDVADEND